MLSYKKIAFRSKAGHRRRGHTDMFYSYDLDLDPMTLTYELDLDILKMYLRTKIEVARWRISKV